MRRLIAVLALLLLALVLALTVAVEVAWPRPAMPMPPAVATYPVARLVALLQAHPGALRGRIVAVTGYYHHACPNCTWDAPPSMTTGPSWGGPSIIIALPDRVKSAVEPAWLAQWRALPLVGRLAPPAPHASGVPEGYSTFTGRAIPCPP